MTKSAVKSKAEAIKCPKCKSMEAERIPRSTVLKTFLPWLGVKHYMCYNCLKKFYKF